LDLEWLYESIRTNWLTILTALAALSSIATFFLARRRPRWRKYRCRGLPYERIFRGKEYGYDPKRFLEDVQSVNAALKEIKTWYAYSTKPLLITGVTGVGKSRLATEFIGRLSWRNRLWIRVLMPSPHELNEMFPPFFTRRCILFLSDLHEFRDKVNDSKLEFYVKSDRFRVVAVIPTEKYDPNWSLLSGFTWQEVRVQNWKLQDGEKLAQIKGIKFTPTGFKGTPLSILAPDAQLKRSYDLLSPAGKSILRALKIIKTHLNCYADYDLISALQSSENRFEYEDFLDIISKNGFWCKTDDSKYMLADGLEDFVQYDVPMSDAYRLQLVLMGVE
jgi:hypothetical protein